MSGEPPRRDDPGRRSFASPQTSSAAALRATASALMCLLGPTAVTAAEQPLATLDADERTPTALVVLAPGNTDPGLDARVLAAVRAVPSSLAVEPSATIGVTSRAVGQCLPTQLITCVVGLIDARRTDAEVLILASVLPIGEGEAAMRALVIDVARARVVLAAPSRTGDGDMEREDRVYRQLHEGPTRTVDPRDARALGAYFADLLPQLRGTIVGALPMGAIALDASTAIAALSLDDHALGAIDAGATTIVNVRAGRRIIRATPADGATIERSIDVQDGRTTALELRPELALATAEPPPWGPWWRGLTWTGAGLGAAGLVLATIGVVSDGDVQQLCLVRASDADATCAGLGAPGFAFDARGTPTADAARVNPSGVGALSLGASLAVTGLAWTAGAVWLGDDAEAPWWVLIAGVALGAVSFAVVAAVSP